MASPASTERSVAHDPVRPCCVVIFVQVAGLPSLLGSCPLVRVFQAYNRLHRKIFATRLLVLFYSKLVMNESMSYSTL